MKNVILLVAFLLAAVACDVAPLPAAASQADGYTVAFFGRVTDIKTGAPLAGAYVHWECGTCGALGGAYTNGDGYYIIPGGSHEGHDVTGFAVAPGYPEMGRSFPDAPPPPIRCNFHLVAE
jgi:hypothetical protein